MRIRGHHLLCLQGFRGIGYSHEFVKRMTEIKSLISSNPEMEIEFGDKADEICEVCPHHGDNCSNIKPGQDLIDVRDRQVLQRLGLPHSGRLCYRELQNLIRFRIKPEDLNEICCTCPWLSLGYCKEGIALMGNSWSY